MIAIEPSGIFESEKANLCWSFPFSSVEKFRIMNERFFSRAMDESSIEKLSPFSIEKRMAAYPDDLSFEISHAPERISLSNGFMIPC